MSVVQNTLIGRARNKIGGTVFSTWKGKNVLKSKPLTVANPQTDAQVAQRSKMTQLVQYFRFMLSYIRQSFVEVSAGSTEWASFMKYNLQNAFSIAGPVATLDCTALTFARGTLINAPSFLATSPLAGSCTVSWVDNSGAPGASASDICLAVAVNAAGDVRISDEGVTRADETFTFTFDTAFSNTEYVVYAWFVNLTSRKSSDSVIILNNL
jgi:hypothetical protein